MTIKNERIKRRNNAVIRRPSSAPFRKRLAFNVGEVLAGLLSERSKAVEFGRRVGSMQLIDRIVRNGLRSRAIRQGDHVRLRNMHRAFWQTEAQDFGESHAFRFREQFLDGDVETFDHVGHLFESATINNVYEIGCGNGQVLNYLADHFPKAKQLVGIDIDESLIQHNQEHFKEERIQFVRADALNWLSDHAQHNSLFVTNGGVLEYFLQDELEQFFSMVSQIQPTAIALIETIGTDHDLSRELATWVYGRELSFSHNYPWLLRENGFEIRHQSERIDRGGNRWLRIVATSGC